MIVIGFSDVRNNTSILQNYPPSRDSSNQYEEINDADVSGNLNDSKITGSSSYCTLQTVHYDLLILFKIDC